MSASRDVLRRSLPGDRAGDEGEPSSKRRGGTADWLNGHPAGRGGDDDTAASASATAGAAAAAARSSMASEAAGAPPPSLLALLSCSWVANLRLSRTWRELLL